MFIVLAKKNSSFKLKLFFVWFVTCCAPGLSKNADQLALAPDSCSNQTRLTIISTPEGVAINMDGQFLGRTPIHRLGIESGNHVLVGLNPDRTRWDAADWLQKILARPGDSLYFNIDFKALTENWIQDAGARQIQPPGLDNPNSRQQGLTPRDDIRSQQDIWQPPDSRSSQKPGVQKSWKKIALVTSVGVAVLSGLAAVHYRDQANAFYASYQASGNPIQMDHYFNKTQYHDRVSGVCYGIFQVSFITSIYLYLSSTSK